MYTIWIERAENGNERKWNHEPFEGGVETKANPGSYNARFIGCTCPVLDNGCGNEELGKSRGFYITQSCPVHNPITQATN